MKSARLPYYTAFFILLVLVLSTSIIGWVESTDRLLIRVTAKISVLFFLLAFTASSIHKLWPSPFSKQLLLARRALGLSFAVSHTFHLCFILLLQFYFDAQNFEERWPFGVLGGGLAYLFIYLMSLTSTNDMQRKLGIKNWRLLHTFGSYYIFIVFCTSYLPRAFAQLIYLPFGLMLIGALLLRGFAAIKKKNS